MPVPSVGSLRFSVGSKVQLRQLHFADPFETERRYLHDSKRPRYVSAVSVAKELWTSWVGGSFLQARCVEVGKPWRQTPRELVNH